MCGWCRIQHIGNGNFLNQRRIILLIILLYMAQSVTKYKYKGKTGTIMLLVEEQANKIVSVYNQNV